MRSCSDYPLANDVNKITNEIGEKRERKTIYNLSWRASHFLQFNSCIMSVVCSWNRRNTTRKEAYTVHTHTHRSIVKKEKRCRHQLVPLKHCGNRFALLMQQQQHLWWVPLTLAIIIDTHTVCCRCRRSKSNKKQNVITPKLYQIHQQVFYFECKITLHFICKHLKTGEKNGDRRKKKKIKAKDAGGNGEKK